jgi:hypothetical protein
MVSRRDSYSRRLVTPANPAAGAEIDITPNEAAIWVVKHLIFTFTASAAVANRQVLLRADAGGTPFYAAPSTVVQAAASADTYIGYPQAVHAAAALGIVLLPLPSEGLVLEQGWHLRTVTSGLDVADQYTAVSAIVESWPTAADLAHIPAGLWVEQDYTGAS